MFQTTMVAGLQILASPCSKCGSKMFVRPCPCFLNKKGWKTCARCVKCGHIVGIEKKTAGKARKKR